MLFLKAVRLVFADLGVFTFEADIGVHPKQVAALCLSNNGTIFTNEKIRYLTTFKNSNDIIEIQI